jgi:endonuclease YncB( thermonuclease family)
VKRWVVFFLFFFFIPLSYSQETRTVTQVLSGDTIVLDGKETVRLIGVWAPKAEVGKKPDSVIASRERRSREYTKGLVLNRPVRLEYDGPKTNEKGETLAYVFFDVGPNTFLLNRLLVSSGFAKVQWKSPFHYRTDFKALEREAAIHKRGLWQVLF